MSWGPLRPSEGRLGRLGPLLDRLGALLDRRGSLLKPFGPVLGPSGAQTSHATRLDGAQRARGKP